MTRTTHTQIPTGPATTRDLATEVTTTAARARALEMVLRGRLDGLLHGDHLGRLPGPGEEAGEARDYQVGDDVRHIDWALSARTGTVAVRQTIADREAWTWLVVDTSPSMAFGTAAWTKADLAVAMVAAVAVAADGPGNRLGAVLVGGPAPEVVPARSGRDVLHQLLLRLMRRPRPADVEPDGPRPPGLPEGLRTVEALARRRGRVVVVSDLLDPAIGPPLARLALRHQVIVAEVHDPREDHLPDVGLLMLVDPETGRRREVHTSRRRTREAFAAAAAERRDRVRAEVRAAGAHHLRLSTDQDWLPALATALPRRDMPSPEVIPA